MIKNILITGVGGQGLLTLGKIIGSALMKADYNVRVAETHGLSQRGGSVLVHVKFSDEEYISPTISPGYGDIEISLELIEAVRNLYMLKKDAIIVSNDLILPPPAAKNVPSKELLLNELFHFNNVHIVSASEKALELGNISVTNIIMLGYIVNQGILPVKKDIVVESIKENIREKFWDINLKAFKIGYKLESYKKGLNKNCEKFG